MTPTPVGTQRAPVQSAGADYRQRLFARYFSTFYGALHTATPASLEKDCQTWKDYFRNLLPQDKLARILDMGCGYGSFLYFLAKEGYSHAVGVDVSGEQVEVARKLGVPNVLLGDGRDFLEKHPVEFDCLTAVDLLEHFDKEEILSLLCAVHRSLKPGGRLILRVPNADGPFGAKILFSDFTHELAFTPNSIRQVLMTAEFECPEVYPEGPRVHGLTSAARWVVWKAISVLLLLYLGAETGRMRGHILTQNLIAVARKPRPMPPGELLR